MTTKYVALLRGINVGGNTKVAMSTLKETFEKLGFVNVKTYINSGNVIFDSEITDTKKLQKLIENELLTTFGFSLQIVLRDSITIKKLIKNIPNSWTNDTTQKTDVLFLFDDYDHPQTISQILVTKDVDTLLYKEGAIIWNIQRSEYTKSSMKKFIGTSLYKNMTARNINTVRKLGELLGQTSKK